MAADRALAKLDQTACDDIGALNGDPDWNVTVKAAQIILGVLP